MFYRSPGRQTSAPQKAAEGEVAEQTGSEQPPPCGGAGEKSPPARKPEETLAALLPKPRSGKDRAAPPSTRLDFHDVVRSGFAAAGGGHADEPRAAAQLAEVAGPKIAESGLNAARQLKQNAIQ